MTGIFRETFESQTDRTTDKWDSYLTVYDRSEERRVGKEC